jgi:hypothetical protein
MRPRRAGKRPAQGLEDPPQDPLLSAPSTEIVKAILVLIHAG